jgi:hypothetical protein
MARKNPTPRTDPGEGMVAVSLPISLMLEANGIGVDNYLLLVRSGELDTARRPVKFTSAPSAVETLRRDYRRSIPEGLPDIAGDVTWRKAQGRWSLDVNHALLAEDVHWWEQIPKGTGDAQLRIDGVVLPDTVMARVSEMAGRPLHEIVQHPMLEDDRILIRDVVSYQPVRFKTEITRGSVQIRLTVPRIEYPDPFVDASTR